MKQFLLIALLQGIVCIAAAQMPAGAIPSAEMKQVLAELKKEIATLETEIKKAEKEDPESAAFMKTQLKTYKTMLAGFEPAKSAAVKPAPVAAKKEMIQTPSPVVAVHLKQPVVAPTAAQAKDRLFWYRGKKINDSTLVTPKKMLVQYSRKRQMLIVEPDKKEDTSFLSIAARIKNNEKAKKELVEDFDKEKNGFIFYPYLQTSLSVYDDVSKRLSDAVNNTFSFKDAGQGMASSVPGNPPVTPGRGPDAGGDIFFATENESADSIPGAERLMQQLNGVLDDAERKIKQLPPVESFPAPPRHELGRCAVCDEAAAKRQVELDALWVTQYLGREKEILAPVFAAGHTAGLSLGEYGDAIQDRVMSIALQLMDRVTQKNKILWNRYKEQIHYLPVIIPVVLGMDRQQQLLGGEGSFMLNEIVGSMYAAYKKYYKEQVEARNHDFVLNVPFHLGIYRQLELLGADALVPAVGEYFNEMTAYNRFALTMDLDFVFESSADGKLGLRATGKMGTKEKVFVMLYPEGCNYRMMPHKTDLNNKTLEDVTLPFTVMGGIKTVREDHDKLVDYPYAGPPEYAIRFPDARIEFCSPVADTIYLAMIGGDEAVAARAGADLQKMNKTYSIDMAIYANQVLLNEETSGMEQGIQTAGIDILNSVSGMMQQQAPANTLDKIKTQYDGYMEMDNRRQQLEKAYSTEQSYILFNANNRTTVLTDTYHDTKRMMTDGVEVKKGLFHVRMVHEPLK